MHKDNLKQYLINNPSALETVLGHFGIVKFKVLSNGYMRCYKEGSTRMDDYAIDVSTNDGTGNVLYCYDYTSSSESIGDVFALIMKVSGYKFSKVLRKCHECLGLEYEGYYKAMKGTSSVEYNVVEAEAWKPKKKTLSDFPKNTVHDMKMLEGYMSNPILPLIKEYISTHSQRKYRIRFESDYNSSAIIIPHFDWRSTNDLVGIQARVLVSENMSSAVECGLIRKYYNKIKGYRKSENLYGFSHNRWDIIDRKQVIIFEGEKSVMKLDTITFGHSFGVAVGGNCLTTFHKVLLGELSKKHKNFEVIIAFDKDVSEAHVHNTIDYLVDYGCMNVSYIYDEEGLLDEKDSPVDKGTKVFHRLFKERKIVCCEADAEFNNNLDYAMKPTMVKMDEMNFAQTEGSRETKNGIEQ